MKRMGNVLVAVAMMIGSIGAVGCKKPSEQATQPETAPVAQPVEAATSPAPAAQKEAVTVVATAAARLPAPPVLRVENPGPAPSAHHRWMRGYWRYDMPRTVYVWVPGFWEDESVVVTYAPPAPRFEDRGCAPSADYYYAPGYWRWSGREYVWVYGHWTLRRDAGFYYRPRWENVGGRWTYRLERGQHPRTDGDYRRDHDFRRVDRDDRRADAGRDRRDGDHERQHVDADRRAANADKRPAEHHPPVIVNRQAPAPTRTQVKRGHG